MADPVAQATPIANRVGGIFLHVSDLDRATRWYSNLLGLPIRSEDRFPHIHVFRMRDGADLILDVKGFKPRQDRDVLFMFDTQDVGAAHRFALEQGLEIVSEPEDGGPVSFFTFADPDGNVLMACQQHG